MEYQREGTGQTESENSYLPDQEMNFQKIYHLPTPQGPPLSAQRIYSKSRNFSQEIPSASQPLIEAGSVQQPLSQLEKGLEKEPSPVQPTDPPPFGFSFLQQEEKEPFPDDSQEKVSGISESEEEKEGIPQWKAEEIEKWESSARERRKRKKRRLFGVLALCLLLPAGWTSAPVTLPLMKDFVCKAAAYSAAFSLPGSGESFLLQKFAGYFGAHGGNGGRRGIFRNVLFSKYRLRFL